MINRRGQGQISGQVTTSAEGGAGAGDVSVALEGTEFTTKTDAAGGFRISSVPAGEYTVVFRRSGFAERRFQVTVASGANVMINHALDAISGAEADAITITGSRPSALRSSSAPISVLTSQDIERKQIRNMTDLLRGEFAGVFVLNSGLNDWTTQVITRGETGWNYSTSDLNGDYMKIFIDGVELARPTLLSTLDPRSIERIEIVRGPQAGTMYGTDGATGLMKIVTKKGSNGGTKPEIVVQASAGIMDSAYTPNGVTPIVQDHSAQLFGGDDDFGYRLGASYQSTGEWAQRYDSSGLALSGGLRARRGPFTASLSAFRNTRDLYTASYSYACTLPGRSQLPSCLRYKEKGNKDVGLHYPMSETLVALTLGYQASPSWQHTLTIGQDNNSFGYEGAYSPTRNYYQRSENLRRTVRYYTTYDAKISDDLTATVTAGADTVFYRRTNAELQSYSLINGRPDVDSAQSAHTDEDSWDQYGYYGMVEVGYRKQLYLTLASRVDGGIRFVAENKTQQFQPRIGAAYVVDRGPATVKFRAQWGNSARSPIDERAILGGRATNANYLANPAIGPERKVGWDGGVDLTWAGIGSLSVTRYDEEGRNLIMPVVINPTPRLPVWQYQNVGVVTNRGWEFEGNVSRGPVSLRGNLTLIDNRIKTLSNALQNAADRMYQEGDRRLSVPTFTAGLTGTLAVFGGTFSANAFWLGPRRQLDGAAQTRADYGLEPRRPSTRDYYVNVPTLWRLNLRADLPVTNGLDVFARVDNVLKRQDSDRSTTTISPGRTSMLGLRGTFR
ncbi:TonB-dependent receptor [Sphingomonas sp.]|uniref:TonB-dependent receptor n=1 Tax=Sphingomonas sp. TaxID=28214 RepID=UPI002FDAC3C6